MVSWDELLDDVAEVLGSDSLDISHLSALQLYENILPMSPSHASMVALLHARSVPLKEARCEWFERALDALRASEDEALERLFPEVARLAVRATPGALVRFTQDVWSRLGTRSRVAAAGFAVKASAAHEDILGWRRCALESARLLEPRDLALEAKLHSGLAIEHEKEGELLEAHRHACEAVDCARSCNSIWLPFYLQTLGAVEIAMGDVDTGIARYREALQREEDPAGVAIAQRLLANRLLSVGRAQEALDVLSVADSSIEIHLLRARCNHETGKADDAVSEALEAMRVSPENNRARTLALIREFIPDFGVDVAAGDPGDPT